MSIYVTIYRIVAELTGTVELKRIDNQIYIGIIPVNYEYLFGPHYFQKDCEYIETNDIRDVNKYPDYYHVIINKKGEIFTTPTGHVLINYYYLEDFKFLRKDCPIEYRLERISIHTHKHLLRNDLKYIFKLKKKYKLPRPIAYKIILEICKLHFLNSKKYRCGMCIGVRKNKSFIYCQSCCTCCTCKKPNNNCSYCPDCGEAACPDCLKSLNNCCGGY